MKTTNAITIYSVKINLNMNSRIETAGIVPAYNEETTIGLVVRSALRASLVDSVVVVDDGSVDSTASVAKNSANELASSIPFEVITHETNRGKTDALRTGVDYVKSLGSTALKTLVFLDADSSPVWSRDTPDNMKLWQVAVRKIARSPSELPSRNILTGREDSFETLLARYIDEIIEPVVQGRDSMRIGMYQRNVITDTLMTLFDWGGHAGNRAVSVDNWDMITNHLKDKGIDISGWQIEAALNTLIPSEETTSFLMHGVVNIGSRKKTGSTAKGLARMATIHAQAFRGAMKLRNN